MFIDLDRFKAVNDSAGHAAGDALLRELASLMLSMLRSSDVLARLGGQLRILLQTVNSTHQRHALVFIDLDRFKAVNDSAGHAAGDALLRELASLMLSMLRSSDVLARLGGDEFGLLLPDCNVESARFIATRIISAVNDYHFIWEGRVHPATCTGVYRS